MRMMPFYSFKNIGADLAVRMSSLFHLHNALSMENKQLRIHISSLQQAKLIKDGMSEGKTLVQSSFSCNHRALKLPKVVKNSQIIYRCALLLFTQSRELTNF
jgi:hypothetical protein